MAKHYIGFIQAYGPGGEPQAKHFAAIGQLISSFVLIEVALHRLLRHILKLDEDIVRAIYGEARSGNLMSDIKRLSGIKLDPEEVKTAIENTFTKITALKEKRDHVAHREFNAFHDELTFHNRTTARVRPGETAVYTIQQLHQYAEEATELARDVDSITHLRELVPEHGPQPSQRTRLQQGPKGKGRPPAKRGR